MIDYISGKIVELNPTEVVLDCNGIGYSAEISLQTFTTLEKLDSAKIYVYHHIQSNTDTEEYYGFSTKDERALFQLIIGVSGVGVGTARIILSSMSSDEFREAIISENVNTIKSVKGIGLKTAQRMILELKDKLLKGDGSVANDNALFSLSQQNSTMEEASSALQMLGFSKPNIQKALQTLIKSNPTIKVEDLIKSALKVL